MLDERKRQILDFIIQDYVDTAVPVGSRTITRKYNVGVSPATIRNEMSDLEALGYLEQPHVSAGRVPSVKAYRLYVDDLIAGGAESFPRDEEARDCFSRFLVQQEDAAQSAAQALCERTRMTSLVMMPSQPGMRIATLQLVPMPRGAALLVMVTDSGMVRDTVLHVSSRLDPDALYAISRSMTEAFSGQSIQTVQRMLAAYASQGGAEQRVLDGVRTLADQMARQASEDTVFVDGAHNILNFPEYADVQKARAFLSVMESRKRLLDLIREDSSFITVRIGDELSLPEISDCSLITVRFGVGDYHGLLGVIGPARMPYRQTIRTLTTISRSMTELFSAQQA